MLFLHEHHLCPLTSPYTFAVRSSVTTVCVIDRFIIRVLNLVDGSLEESEQNGICKILVLCCVLLLNQTAFGILFRNNFSKSLYLNHPSDKSILVVVLLLVRGFQHPEYRNRTAIFFVKNYILHQCSVLISLMDKASRYLVSYRPVVNCVFAGCNPMAIRHGAPVPAIVCHYVFGVEILSRIPGRKVCACSDTNLLQKLFLGNLVVQRIILIHIC